MNRLLAIVLLSTSILSASAADERLAKDIAQISVHLLVLDPEGEPVENAQIRPVGMRTRVGRGSHYGWAPQRHGEVPVVKTDADGRATIMVPKFVIETLEIGEVTWQVEHDDFILFREDVDVAGDPGTVQLTRGRRIAISAVSAESGERISSDLHAMLSGGGSGAEWTTNNAGLLMSKNVALERRLLRIIHAPKAGQILFSDVIDLNENGDAKRVLLRDVKLHPAATLSGRLHDDVPRPIRNGTVSLNVIVGAQFGIWDARLYWSDWAKITEDGRFKFRALPPGAVAQLIGVCDGWVNDLPTDDETEMLGWEVELPASRVGPQVTELSQPANEIVLRMQKTASIKVTVLDPDGHPLPKAQVYTNPNQIWFGGGSQIVGNGSSVLAGLRLTDEQQGSLNDWASRERLVELGVFCPGGHRYHQVTNAAGVAIVPSIPAGTEDAPRSSSLDIVHEDFVQPLVDPVRMDRSVRLSITNHQQQEVTIRMEKKQTKATDESGLSGLLN